jgi:flagellar protein FlgJ
MDRISPSAAAAPSRPLAPPSELSTEQRDALKRLHAATTQFEGVFVGMMLKAMRDTVPKDSIFGKQSQTEDTFSEMLDDQRAQAMASSGALGIAKVLDEQLRASVLSDAAHESKVSVPR